MVSVPSAPETKKMSLLKVPVTRSSPGPPSTTVPTSVSFPASPLSTTRTPPVFVTSSPPPSATVGQHSVKPSMVQRAVSSSPPPWSQPAPSVIGLLSVYV
jgi:hypothetical protein